MISAVACVWGVQEDAVYVHLCSSLCKHVRSSRLRVRVSTSAAKTQIVCVRVHIVCRRACKEALCALQVALVISHGCHVCVCVQFCEWEGKGIVAMLTSSEQGGGPAPYKCSK